MKLDRTLICLDCNEIYESKNGHNPCPFCSSENNYPIIKWLERKGDNNHGDPGNTTQN